MRSLFLIAFVAAWTLNMAGRDMAVVCAQEERLSKEVCSALEENANQLNDLSIDWTMHEYSYDGSENPAPLAFRLVLQYPMLLLEERCKRNGVEHFSAYAFDGKVFSRGTPSKTVGIAATLSRFRISTLAAERPSEMFYPVEELNNVGFYFPSKMQELNQRKTLSSVLLHRIENGGRLIAIKKEGSSDSAPITVSITGRWFYSLLAEEFDYSNLPPESVNQAKAGNAKLIALPDILYVYHLDPQRHYAVLEWEEQSSGGTVLSRCVNKDFEEIRKGQLWFPKSSSHSCYYRFADNGDLKTFQTPQYRRDYQVAKVGASQLPEKEFYLDYRIPGMSVTDATLPECKTLADAIHYTYPASEADLQTVIDSVSNPQAKAAHARFIAHSRFVVLIVILLVLVAVEGFRIVQKVKKRSV